MVQVQDVSRRYCITNDSFLEIMPLLGTGTTLLLKVSIYSLKFEVSILTIIFFCFRFPERNHLLGAFRYINLRITKTCLYNFDPLKPRFLYCKTGVYRGIHYFSYFCSNIDCGYSLEPPRRVHVHVLSRNMKNIRVFHRKIFSFWRWNFLYIWIGEFS